MLMKNSKVALAALLFAVFGFVNLGLYSSKPLFAAVLQVERNEDELLILETRVNEHIRNKGIIGYLPNPSDLSGTLLPLSSLSRALSFSIKASPSDGTAEGWFRSEKNSFHLDLERRIVTVGGKQSTLPEGAAEAHFEDIYVKVAMLEEWFNITIRPDISLLRVVITSDQPLPFEEDLQRQKKYKNLDGEAESAAIPYDPNHFIPYAWWSKPNFVVQTSLNAAKSEEENTLNSAFSIQSSGDALKFGTKFLLSGSIGNQTDPDFDNAQLTFQKSDPENDLLGILHAGKIEFGDVSFQDVPLAVGQKRGRGLSVSSESDYNFARSLGAEKYNLDGEAPVGWDAELYRNGYFINYQQIGTDGRYNFTDVDLVRGYNLFQIVLYGPDGQKMTQMKRVVRGTEMQRAGEISYDFSIGQPDADLLPITQNSRTSSTIGGGGNIAYGVKEYLTIGASAFSGKDESADDTEEDSDSASRQTSGAVSATVAVKGVKTQVQLMQGNEGRSGYSVDSTTNILDTNLTASHTVYNGFDADDKDLLRTTSLNVNRSFGVFSTNSGIAKKIYQEKEDELEVDIGITTNMLGVQFNNQINYIGSSNTAQEKFTGDLAVLSNIQKWRVRGNLSYDLETNAAEKLRAVNLSASRSLTKDSTLRLNSDYNFTNQMTSLEARYTHQFDKYALDVNIGGTSQNSYFGGVTMRTGFLADHEGKYKMVSAKEGGLGAVGLRAYMDENGNRKYDEGEKPLENLGFRSNRGLIKGKTDEKGFLFINGLVESPTRFSLDQESVQSIYIKPYDDYLDIIPRSGTVATIEMGFEQLGEIDGFIYAGSKENPVSGVEIILVNAQTNEEVDSISSEHDGYFVFSALAMGEYKINIIPAWGDADVTTIMTITLDKENPMAIGKEILLPASLAQIPSGQEMADIIEPAAGDAATEEQVHHVIEDAPKPIVTDGMDAATGEALRGLFIHVGSVGDFKGAQDEQKRLWAMYPDILGDIPLYVYKIEVGGKTYFRIVGAVDDKPQGDELCSSLNAAHSVGGCILMKL